MVVPNYIELLQSFNKEIHFNVLGRCIACSKQQSIIIFLLGANITAIRLCLNTLCPTKDWVWEYRILCCLLFSSLALSNKEFGLKMAFNNRTLYEKLNKWKASYSTEASGDRDHPDTHDWQEAAATFFHWKTSLRLVCHHLKEKEIQTALPWIARGAHCQQLWIKGANPNRKTNQPNKQNEDRPPSLKNEPKIR